MRCYIRIYSLRLLGTYWRNTHTISPSSSLATSRLEFLPKTIWNIFSWRMADNRFCIEYAKTGRSSCKKCKQQIEKGVGRIGKLTANPFSDDGGDMKAWFHMRCMFETFKVSIWVVNDPLPYYYGLHFALYLYVNSKWLWLFLHYAYSTQCTTMTTKTA